MNKITVKRRLNERKAIHQTKEKLKAVEGFLVWWIHNMYEQYNIFSKALMLLYLERSKAIISLIICYRYRSPGGG